MTANRFDRLYVYEGCKNHGVKVGVTSANGLSRRIIGLRSRCPASRQFAKVWELPNAYEIEQFVIGTLAVSERTAGDGEEWFNISLDEMLVAIEFALDWHSPDYRSRPRRFRVMCGHVTRAEA